MNFEEQVAIQAGPQRCGATWLRRNISLRFSPLLGWFDFLNPPAAEGGLILLNDYK